MKVVPSGSQPTTRQFDTGSSSKAAREKVINMLTQPEAAPQPPVEAQAPNIPAPNHQAVDSAPQVSEVTEVPVQASAPAAPAPAKEDPLHSQYALLARKEKALRAKVQQQEQAILAREEALKAKEAEIAAKAQQYDSDYVPKSRLRQSTLEVLAENELDYNELSQQMINQTPQDPRTQAHISKLEQKLAKLESALEKANTTYEENSKQSYQAAIKQIDIDVRNLVYNDPAYEVIKETKSAKDVTNLIERVWTEEKRVMSTEEAADEVEKYLTEQGLRIARINKIQQQSRQAVSKPEPTAPAQQPAAPQQQPQQMRTLTNANSTTRRLTARERALMAFRGELK